MCVKLKVLRSRAGGTAILYHATQSHIAKISPESLLGMHCIRYDVIVQYSSCSTSTYK